MDAHAESSADQTLVGSVLGEVENVVEATTRSAVPVPADDRDQSAAPRAQQPVHTAIERRVERVARPVTKIASPVRPAPSTTTPTENAEPRAPRAERPHHAATPTRASRPAPRHQTRPEARHRPKPVARAVGSVADVVLPVTTPLVDVGPTVDATVGVVDETVAALGLTPFLAPVVDDVVVPVVTPIVDQVVTPAVEVVEPVIDVVEPVTAVPPVVVAPSAAPLPDVATGSGPVSRAVDRADDPRALPTRSVTGTRGRTTRLVEPASTAAAATSVHGAIQRPTVAPTATSGSQEQEPTTPTSMSACAPAAGTATGGGAGGVVGVLETDQHSLSTTTALLAVADLGAALRVPRQPGFAPD